MRVAAIRQSGATPALDQLADPQPGQGLSVGTLVAAALNPLEVAITTTSSRSAGSSPLRRRLGSGRAARRRTRRPAAPYGTLADLAPVPDAAALSGPARPRSRPRRRPRGGRDGRLGGARLPRPPPARRDSADPRGRRPPGAVVITEAGGGLGREVGLKLASDGYRIFGTALSQQEVMQVAVLRAARYPSPSRTLLTRARSRRG